LENKNNRGKLEGNSSRQNSKSIQSKITEQNYMVKEESGKRGKR